MKIADLKKNITFYDGSSEEILGEFMNCNPKQIISYDLIVPVWKVVYSYITKRGNPKKATKYLLRHFADWDVVELEFEQYIEDFNKMYPERKISNVKILDIDFLGKAYIELE